MKFMKAAALAAYTLGFVWATTVHAQINTAPKYDFNYRITDERISVFDDGRMTRIQLPEGMNIPILMSQEPAGDVLLEITKDSPYLTVQGTYTKLVMRWTGGREAVASYKGRADIERMGRAAAFGAVTPARTYGAVAAPVDFQKTQIAIQTLERAPSLGVAQKRMEVNEPAKSPAALPATLATPIAAPATVTTSVATVAASMPQFEVTPADQNFRKVLVKWSKASGWTFEPEHWAVSRDIPVSGSDAVVTDYKTAVRRLLKSSALTDLPVQPCFYSNNVLRVIPASELCARSDN